MDLTAIADRIETWTRRRRGRLAPDPLQLQVDAPWSRSDGPTLAGDLTRFVDGLVTLHYVDRWGELAADLDPEAAAAGFVTLLVDDACDRRAPMSPMAQTVAAIRRDFAVRLLRRLVESCLDPDPEHRPSDGEATRTERPRVQHSTRTVRPPRRKQVHRPQRPKRDPDTS